MVYSNLHTHTLYSDGKHGIEENVVSAVNSGMVSIGISDHSYTPCDSTYCMKENAFSDYIDEIERMQKKYGDKITVFKGLELDYYSEVDRDKLDYIIGSVHYAEVGGIYYQFGHSPKQQISCIRDELGGNILDFAKIYYETVLKMVEKNKPDIVGHFDAVTKYGLYDGNEEYRKIALETMEEVLKYCKYIELNTGDLARKVREIPYPEDYILEYVLKNGGEIVLGSDSHHKDTLTCNFDNCVENLKKIGYNHISRFNGKDFEKVYF